MKDSPLAACPAWCVDDHSESARHRSAVREVVAVRRATEGAESVELLIEVFRYPEDAHAWMYLGDGDVTGMEISAESAARLATALWAAAQSILQ